MQKKLLHCASPQVSLRPTADTPQFLSTAAIITKDSFCFLALVFWRGMHKAEVEASSMSIVVWCLVSGLSSTSITSSISLSFVFPTSLLLSGHPDSTKLSRPKL